MQAVFVSLTRCSLMPMGVISVGVGRVRGDLRVDSENFGIWRRRHGRVARPRRPRRRQNAPQGRFLGFPHPPVPGGETQGETPDRRTLESDKMRPRGVNPESEQGFCHATWPSQIS